MGDSDAWAALCGQYSERLWRYVSRLIGSNESAVADVFQETLLAVARSGRGLSDNSRLWAWLAAIGHHQCSAYWRQQARTKTQVLVEDATVVEPEDALIQQEVVTLVRLILADMSSDHVMVLTAKYSDGLSAVEIAEQLGDGVEAVRSRLARARKEFRHQYEALTMSTSMKKSQ